MQLRFFMILCVLTMAGMVLGQQYYTDAQKKSLARRAAIVDGYRLLAESIKGVKISAHTTVKDFVAENDQISASLDQFVVRGAQVETTRYQADGTCEVDVILNVADLINFMRITQNQYQLSRWKDNNFDDINRLHQGSVIRATGTGAPPGGISTKEMNEILAENQNMRQQISEMTLKMDELNRRLGEARTTQQNFVQLLQENKSLKDDIERAKDSQIQLMGIMRENNGLKNKLQQIEEENQGLKGELQRVKQVFGEISAYKQKYEAMFSQSQEFQRKIGELEQLARTQREESQKQIQKTEEEVQKWKQQVQNLQNIFNHFKAYKEKYEEEVIKSQQSIQEVQKVKNQLHQLHELQQKFTEMRNMITQMNQENEKLRQEINFNSQWRQKLQAEQEQSHRLNLDKNQLLAQTKTLQNTISDLNNKISDLQNEIASLKSQPTGVWVTGSSRHKLMARRAATMDGYRLLLESLQGVRIDANTTVRDFVTTNDEIKVAIQGYIQGMQITATRYLPDGICEVDMEVDMQDYVKFLTMTAQNLKTQEWASRCSNIQQYDTRRIIKVTGTGTFEQN